MTSVLTLAIDASTYAGSVCVARGTSVLAEDTTPMRGDDVERLMPAIAGTLERAGVTLDRVDRVVCGEGPGSFTSLRIAASIAKGIAMSRGCPLHAVSSLALMVAASDRTRVAGEYLATLDALRGERYVARCAVDASGAVVAVSPVTLLDAGAIAELIARGERVVGPDCPIGAVPHAHGVVRLGVVLAERPPVDLASWEPNYGRLAEAQVKWEAAHGRALPVG